MARPVDLLPVEEARRRILIRFGRLPAENVSLELARGRVLAVAIEAPFPLPPFANSSMDGFAIVSRATAGAERERPIRLQVVAHIRAGTHPDVFVAEGTAARIMTGAPLPEGSDAVVPFEDVEESDGSILVFNPIAVGACVRQAGQDTPRGQMVLEPGIELLAPQIALLAALGKGSIPVSIRPRVAVLATGDELVDPGHELRPGQIYNSNTPMLVAAIAEAGGVPVVIGTRGDTVEAIEEALGSAAECDLLITSGGASVGDFDHVKEALGRAGEVSFWRVRVRPGKPLLFGSIGAMPVFGLPGNPTSAMVTYEQFVRPAIRTMVGAPPLRPLIEAVVDARVDNRGGRRTFFRVQLEYRADQFHAVLAGPQDSAMLVPLAHADGLMEIAEDREVVLPGEIAAVHVWRLPHSSTAG